MGSVKKSSFVIIWLFSYGQKAWGGTGYKVNVMKLKFYRVSGQKIMDGITWDRAEIADSKLYRQFEKMVKYDRIFKLFMDFIQL